MESRAREVIVRSVLKWHLCNGLADKLLLFSNDNWDFEFFLEILDAIFLDYFCVIQLHWGHVARGFSSQFSLPFLNFISSAKVNVLLDVGRSDTIQDLIHFHARIYRMKTWYRCFTFCFKIPIVEIR